MTSEFWRERHAGRATTCRSLKMSISRALKVAGFAAVLWLLGQHGPSVAALGCCAIFFAITRMVVIYIYLCATAGT